MGRKCYICFDTLYDWHICCSECWLYSCPMGRLQRCCMYSAVCDLIIKTGRFHFFKCPFDFIYASVNLNFVSNQLLRLLLELDRYLRWFIHDKNKTVHYALKIAYTLSGNLFKFVYYSQDYSQIIPWVIPEV